MIKSKSIGLLKTFSETEFKRFGFFIRSPLFNRDVLITKFYEILAKYYPGFDRKGFDKEKIFAALYPGKKYSDGMMRNLLSRMLELERMFLAVNNFLNKDFNFRISLLEEFRERNQINLFDQEKNKIIELLSQEIKDSDFYYKSTLLESEIKKFHSKQKSTYRFEDKVEFKLYENISNSFIINILKINLQIATNKIILSNEKYKDDLMIMVEKYLTKENKKIHENVYIKYLYNAYKLIETQDGKYFELLRELINNDYESLNQVDKNDIFVILTNYCYSRINKGETEFVKQQFSLYKENIERGNYKGIKKFISHLFFMNTVICGLESGEITWVKNFIELYKKELDDINRENTYTFCLALLHYWESDYKKALEEASKIVTNDLSYKHQLKSLYLKIYFDMNEQESFYSHIDSYKHFIKKDINLPKNTLIFIKNYLDYSKILFDIKNKEKSHESDLKVLRDEIIDNESMINKTWLLRKIDEFLN
jgi:hypothetical protein